MCQHNEEDYDCCDCAYERGLEDALEGIYNNLYKNWDQCNSYDDGYKSLSKIDI